MSTCEEQIVFVGKKNIIRIVQNPKVEGEKFVGYWFLPAFASATCLTRYKKKNHYA